MQGTVRRDGKRDERSRRSSHSICSAMFANLLRRCNMEGVEVDLPPLGQVGRTTNVRVDQRHVRHQALVLLGPSIADSRDVDIALHLAAMRMGGYLPSRTRIPHCIDDALKTSFVQHRPNRTSKVVMRRGKLGGSAFAGLEMMCSNGGIELALTSITFRRTLADRHAMEIAVEHLSIAVREGLEGVVARDSHRRVAQVSLRKMSEDGRLQDPILRLERVCPAAVQGEDITLLIGQRSASMHMAREDAHDKRGHISLRRGRNEVLMRRVDESAQTRDVYHRCRGASCVIRHSSRGRWDRRAICSRCR
mmetsp:Transcript_4060/g.15037  ORF Transcript_4060/g.15037 Transcript_4060/m.15037 type:complete len:306 (+) Transcript_4060:305-1222(+)